MFWKKYPKGFEEKYNPEAKTFPSNTLAGYSNPKIKFRHKDWALYSRVLLPQRKIISVPKYDDHLEMEEIHEWWGKNTVEILYEAKIIWEFVTTDNDAWTNLVSISHEESIKSSGYPEGVSYKWKSANDIQPVTLPIDEYIDNVFTWLISQVENKEIFPTDEQAPFPDDMRKHVKKMFRRIFRVFAVIYSNDCLCENIGAKETSLEKTFIHFLYFALKWELLGNRQVDTMATLTATIKAGFKKDHERHLHEVGCYNATFIKGHEHLRAEHYNDPASVDIINQWWNDRTKSFHEELRNLWETLTEGNVNWNLEQRKAEEGAIDDFSKSVAYSLNLPEAGEYVDMILSWLDSQFKNEKIFPFGNGSQDDFKRQVEKVFKMMFRVLTAILRNKCLYEKDPQAVIAFLKPLLCFGWTWGLHNINKTDTLEEFVGWVRETFEMEEQDYIKKLQS